MTSRFDHQWMMPQDDADRPAMRLVPDGEWAEAFSEARDARDPQTADGQAWSAEAAGTVDDHAADDDADHTPLRMVFERRAFRRFDVESWNVSVERWEGRTDETTVFGKVIDLSPGGVRLRTRNAGIHPDQQIRVRLDLPPVSGISPFVDVADGQARPKREWTGWLAVARVRENGDGTFDVAGRLEDMAAMDRGMLGLYLSAQPLAA